MRAIWLVFWVSVFFSAPVLAQEEAGGEPSIEEEPHVPQIRVALMMANSHIPRAFEGERRVSIIPTWGADVDYFFNRRWSVALQADVLLQYFEIEEENQRLERSYPFSSALVIHYHALRHWSFYIGPGFEFEKSKNLFLVKLGTEYSIEINEDWEIGFNLVYNQREEVYNSWIFGVAFNRRVWVKD